jgi:hypothetical protein
VWSNCYLYALRQWYWHGGYVVLAKSKYGWWPHALWSPDLRHFDEFVPDKPRRRWFPPLLFQGHVKTRFVEEQPCTT